LNNLVSRRSTLVSEPTGFSYPIHLESTNSTLDAAAH
jgi:hypothetical protein